MELRKYDYCLVLAILSCVITTGCDSNEEYEVFDPKQTDAAELDHDHEHHEAPHGGHLIELGDHAFHAEVIFEEQSGKITVYILDGHAEETHVIDQQELTLNMTVDEKPQQYKLMSAPLDGEPEGKSSRFESSSKELFDHFHEHEGFKAKLKVVIDGKQYLGVVEHKDHYEDDHNHD